MPAEALFGLCNSAALLSWSALILVPPRRYVAMVLRWGVITALALLYTVLIAIYFFRVEGGGFFSLPAVQQLFTSPEIALAGWIHYLAFDLFVGLWIADRGDAMGLSRWIQAPILAATFMFGPFGLLLFYSVLGAERLRSRLARVSHETLSSQGGTQ